MIITIKKINKTYQVFVDDMNIAIKLLYMPYYYILLKKLYEAFSDISFGDKIIYNINKKPLEDIIKSLIEFASDTKLDIKIKCDFGKEKKENIEEEMYYEKYL